MDTSWRTTLEQFLKPWFATPEVIGVLVCGSYVTGHPSPFSDIDVHLVRAASVGWRERGNRSVDGGLMEYFANPIRQIRNGL